MVNEKKYFDELQKVIDDTGSTDMINERWKEVIERLNQLSVEYCKELQAETGASYEKSEPSGIMYDLDKFPPNRLLAIALILNNWVGWHSVPKKLDSISDWERIEDACDKGRNAYIEYRKAEDA